MIDTHHFFLFFVALLVVSPASAGTMETINDVAKVVNNTIEITNFVADLLSQKNWDRDWKVATDEGKPRKIVKSRDHLRAWISITGFRNESRINGTRYVNGAAKDFAIVQRSEWHTWEPEMVVVSFKSNLNIIDSIVLNGSNTTTATQRTDLHWKYWKNKLLGSGYWINEYEDLTVSCTVEAPENFTTQIPGINITITRFNRSFKDVTYIDVPTANHPSMQDVMSVVADYNGSKLRRYDQIGWVCKNTCGAEFVEFVDNGLPLWVMDDNQTTIHHCGKSIIVSTENFNISKLNISIHTPYESVNLSNFTVTDVSGSTVISVPILRIILIIAVMILSIIGIWKVFVCVM